MLVANAFEELIELLQKLLDTIGLSGDPNEESSILHEMLENALNNNLVNEFIEALTSSGKTLSDVLRSVIIDHSKALLEALVYTWIELQRPVEDLLDAVEDVQEEALDEVCQLIIGMFARKMKQSEINIAEPIYGSTFDYDTVYLTEDGVVNEVVFEVQSWFNENPGARAFVTFKLINHDVDEGPLKNWTLIHELCHVWQFQDAGPVYMIQAIHAQTLGGGYNYGYDDNFSGKRWGKGADAKIKKLKTDNPTLSDYELFDTFNREEQAQLIKHYYVRKYEYSPPKDFAPWQPFQNVVYTP